MFLRVAAGRPYGVTVADRAQRTSVHHQRRIVSRRLACSAGYEHVRADRRVWQSRPTVAPPRG
jgi:hypothetical protein